MAEMGHSNQRTFLQHYRERVDPDDAEVYWKIRPPSKPDKELPQKSAKKCSLPPVPKTAQRGYNLMKTELSLLEGSIFTKNRSADQRQVA
jgi:hypothetical protein